MKPLRQSQYKTARHPVYPDLLLLFSLVSNHILSPRVPAFWLLLSCALHFFPSLLRQVLLNKPHSLFSLDTTL
ncbi:unnamed protein product [Parascedosporium putredinis]|uniref:Uncharacterized protein n=1 Tax=Parascedosporium putredinis TaxID=1442378 RepID=A0A9P1GVR0_9PEZI|nr:unnamed protein product [Parascedosporium putredinis]CAI7987946.1 unnamed protein product [Parascedosporium putredinis]